MILHNGRQNSGDWKEIFIHEWQNVWINLCSKGKDMHAVNVCHGTNKKKIAASLIFGLHTRVYICLLQLQLILNGCAKKSTKTILHACRVNKPK